jgi:hypothetical protein
MFWRVWGLVSLPDLNHFSIEDLSSTRDNGANVNLPALLRVVFCLCLLTRHSVRRNDRIDEDSTHNWIDEASNVREKQFSRDHGQHHGISPRTVQTPPLLNLLLGDAVILDHLDVQPNGGSIACVGRGETRAALI